MTFRVAISPGLSAPALSVPSFDVPHLVVPDLAVPFLSLLLAILALLSVVILLPVGDHLNRSELNRSQLRGFLIPFLDVFLPFVDVLLGSFPVLVNTNSIDLLLELLLILDLVEFSLGDTPGILRRSLSSLVGHSFNWSNTELDMSDFTIFPRSCMAIIALLLLFGLFVSLHSSLHSSLLVALGEEFGLLMKLIELGLNNFLAVILRGINSLGPFVAVPNSASNWSLGDNNGLAAPIVIIVTKREGLGLMSIIVMMFPAIIMFSLAIVACEGD